MLAEEDGVRGGEARLVRVALVAGHKARECGQRSAILFLQFAFIFIFCCIGISILLCFFHAFEKTAGALIVSI